VLSVAAAVSTTRRIWWLTLSSDYVLQSPKLKIRNQRVVIEVATTHQPELESVVGCQSAMHGSNPESSSRYVKLEVIARRSRPRRCSRLATYNIVFVNSGDHDNINRYIFRLVVRLIVLAWSCQAAMFNMAGTNVEFERLYFHTNSWDPRNA
jgi:hypothetical protein